jgi:hypothetical protein
MKYNTTRESTWLHVYSHDFVASTAEGSYSFKIIASHMQLKADSDAEARRADITKRANVRSYQPVLALLRDLSKMEHGSRRGAALHCSRPLGRGSDAELIDD